MKAIQLRQLITPLLLGGALFAASLPAMADREHRRYEPPRLQHKHYDQRKHSHHYHRGKPHYVKHEKHRPHGVVHHYYFPPAPMYSPPPRVHYHYEPAVVVRVPPIAINIK